MKDLKIFAQYIPYNDTYTATVQNGSKAEIISKPNGDELEEAVNRLYGVNIEYNPQTRKFSIPEKNRF